MSPSARVESGGVDGRLRVAAVQVNSQAELEQNLAAVRDLVARAAAFGAELVLLPENFAFMGPEAQRTRYAEPLGDVEAPIQRCLSELARGHAITVVGGGFPEQSDDVERPYNTAVVFDAGGKLVQHYRKLHLFDVRLGDGTNLAESASTKAGVEPKAFEWRGLRVGLSICYDLRFPELYRGLSRQGLDLILLPAAFTLHTGKDHWHVLLRARAIENQCWMLAAGQWGSHPQNRRSYGHSLLVDPWGTIVAECSDGTGVCVGELDPALSERVRAGLPALAHRVLGA